MTKERFIYSINAIEKQIRHDDKFAEQLGKAFPTAFTANLNYDNHYVIEALLKVLEEEMNDKGEWIGWFCYDTDFGKRSDSLTAYEGNKVIPMDNASDLYDFLAKNLENDE